MPLFDSEKRFSKINYKIFTIYPNFRLFEPGSNGSDGSDNRDSVVDPKSAKSHARIF